MSFPITDEEIAKSEAKSGFTFPTAFKKKMSRMNGGEVAVAGDTWVLYPFFDQSDRKRLARTCNDILRESAQMRQWQGFPVGAFAIASNGCGDCLFLMPDHDGSHVLGETIFRFDHETGESEPVASSITACK